MHRPQGKNQTYLTDRVNQILMGWYSFDAIGVAINRTKQVLIPFNFRKWIKLGIIAIFTGGIGFSGFNYNPAVFNFQRNGVEGLSLNEVLNKISQFWHQYETYILIAISAIVFLILLLSLVSSVMEFVLIESLVTDIISIRAYFKKYLRPGFNLFLLQLVLGISILLLFILAILPALMPFLESPGSVTFVTILEAITYSIVMILLFAVIGGIIQSFISLSIPLVMYSDTGIVAAMKKVIGRSRTDAKQILVYWIVRVAAWLAAGLIVGIAALILFIIIFGVIILLGLGLYYLLKETVLFWIVMIPYGLIASILLILFILIISVPVPVFMKYHMLAFLQSWYQDVNIPFPTTRTSIT